MDQLDASLGAKILVLCPQIALVKSLLGMNKTPSARMLAGQGSSFRADAPVGRISFKLGQKMLRKWYRMTAAAPEPLMTQ